MPTAVALPGGTAVASGGKAKSDGGDQQVVAVNPFVRASRQTTEVFGDRSTVLQAGASTQVSDVAVPAFGFARSVTVLVEGSAGAGGAANVAAAADAPWSVLQDIQVTDTNGRSIIGPLSGFDLYLANKWLPQHDGYDPALSPEFSAVAEGAGASGNFSFLLDLPFEIGPRDGLGSLPNQNAASVYRIAYTIAAATAVYATAPATTLPTVRVRFYLNAWSPVEAADLRGVPNQMEPPASGTTQHIVKSIHDVVAGENRVRFTRVGNLIRGFVLVFRDVTGARSTADLPDAVRVEYDNKNVEVTNRKVVRDRMWRRSAGYTLDDGVLVLDYVSDLDGKLGSEMRDGWLPTTQATRLELVGSFGAAGTLHVITNDVAPAGNVYV